MATRRVEIGATGETVRTNIANARKEQRLTLRDLAERLAENGRPLAHNTLSEIERGARRVDVDDLFAIAVALDIAPSALLMPQVDHRHTPVEVTGAAEVVDALDVRNFIEGFRPLGPARHSRLDSFDFMLRSLPLYDQPRRWRSPSSSAALPFLQIQVESDGTKISRSIGIDDKTLFPDEDD